MRSIICFEFRTLLLFALGHITFWVCVSIRGGVRHKRSHPCDIFQNVSSAFARFIGGAKGDIRISQLNTTDSLNLLCFPNPAKKRRDTGLLFSSANIYLHFLYKTKKPRCCRTPIYTRYLSRSNIHRKPNKGLRNETYAKHHLL